jgi:3-hydroxyisobutyrate dehydrogenase
MKDKLRIGFVGLGAMGSGMASRLLSKGHRVCANDARGDARAPWAAQGGLWAATPAEAARGAAALALMVVSAEQVDEVLFGAEGALTTLPAGSVVIVHSTVPASFSRELGARLAGTGHLMLDAPVSGGAAAARKGSLSVIASGAPEAFAAAQPLLDAVAARVFRVGDHPGMGSAVKTVNQLLAGIHIAAAAEAVAFGAKAGVDTRVLFEVISSCAGNSWMFSNRVPHMLDGDYRPLSAVNIFVKDLGIVLDSARELRFPAPLAGLAHQLFIMAASSGHGLEDDAAVVKVYESLAGVSVASKGARPSP